MFLFTLCVGPMLLVFHAGQDSWVMERRALESQRQTAARQLRVLSDNVHMLEQAQETVNTKDALALALVDRLGVFAAHNSTELIHLSVKGLTPANNSYSISTLRVSIAVALPRAVGLFEVLDALQSAVGWLPLEVRGCTLQRQSSTDEVKADCIVDIYYFPSMNS